MSQVAADHASVVLRQAIRDRGRARLVAATGRSQVRFLECLVATPTVDWSLVELFHLDEYIGVGPDHQASFCRFLTDRLITPTGIVHAHLLDGLADPAQVMRDVGRALTAAPVDLLLCGIGENGHLAFNEPPANFQAADPYILVTLDDTSRRQQVGPGRFERLDDVPEMAMTMSIPQILLAREILCLAFGAQKAGAVRACFSGDVRPEAPASVLRTHTNATVYLDAEVAATLPRSLGGLALG